MNIIQKNRGCFYAFFRFSSNSRKGIDKAEKEKFGFFVLMTLKLKTINARNLIKSFQPIHKLINILIISSINLKY